MFILKRTDQGGGYVAPPGSLKSYVRNPVKARRFATREEADRNRCVENETIVALADLVGQL